LADATGAATLRPAHPEEIHGALGASPGSLGAVGVTGIPVIADEALRDRQDMTTGANTDGVHIRGVQVDRDIAVDSWADLRKVIVGEPCIRCNQPLEVQQAIEVGHIFKLGYRYSEVLGATVVGAHGDPERIIMGCYGIGIERAMAAIVECHHDDKGIAWPAAVAPLDVAVVVAQADHAKCVEVGEQVYQQLCAEGVKAIIDDRNERAGVKFKDVELVGIPLRVTVGTRGLANGEVELTERATGETERLPIADVVDVAMKRIDASQ